MGPNMEELYEMRKNVGKQAKYDGLVWTITGVHMKSDDFYGHYSTDWWEYILTKVGGMIELEDSAREKDIEIMRL